MTRRPRRNHSPPSSRMWRSPQISGEHILVDCLSSSTCTPNRSTAERPARWGGATGVFGDEAGAEPTDPATDVKTLHGNSVFAPLAGGNAGERADSFLCHAVRSVSRRAEEAAGTTRRSAIGRMSKLRCKFSTDRSMTEESSTEEPSGRLDLIGILDSRLTSLKASADSSIPFAVGSVIGIFQSELMRHFDKRDRLIGSPRRASLDEPAPNNRLRDRARISLRGRTAMNAIVDISQDLARFATTTRYGNIPTAAIEAQKKHSRSALSDPRVK